MLDTVEEVGQVLSIEGGDGDDLGAWEGGLPAADDLVHATQLPGHRGGWVRQGSSRGEGEGLGWLWLSGKRTTWEFGDE